MNTKIPEHIFKSSEDENADICAVCGGKSTDDLPCHVKFGDPRIVWDANGFHLKAAEAVK